MSPKENRSIAGVSDEAVLRATGKDWAGWLRKLDTIRAEEKSHKEIAAYLHEHAGLSPWWSQQVTVGYEQARGMRVKHQKGTTFEISRSKTIAVPIGQLYKAWSDASQRERWLPGHPIHIRKATPEKSMRITWSDEETGLNVHFYEKAENKSQVVVQHVKIADQESAEKNKSFWSRALGDLKRLLETP